MADEESTYTVPSRDSLGPNIAKLLSSKVAAQVVAFGTAPIVTRLFSPDDFGVRQIFISITAVITAVTCLKYEASIPLGRDKKEAIASFVLSLSLAFIFALAVFAVVPIANGKVVQWFKSPELGVFLWLLPIVALTSGLGSSLRFWAAREGRFGAIAWSGFGSTLSSRLIVIASALMVGGSATGLVAGYFAGFISGVLLFLTFLGRELGSDIKNSDLSFKTLWTVAKRYRKFPIFDIWSTLLSVISIQLVPIVFGSLFSKAVVGYYSLGHRLVSLPLDLLGSSIAQAFYPAAAKEYSETGTLSNIVGSVFKSVIQVSVFPTLMLSFLGAAIFRFIFGQEWVEAGVYTQILSSWFILLFISSPFGSVFFILNRQGTRLFLSILATSVRVSSLLIGSIIFPPRGALAIFAVCNVLVLTLLDVVILRWSKVSILWLVRIASKYIALSCVLILPGKLISLWFAGDLLAILWVVFAAIAYISILLKIEPSLKQYFLQFWARLGRRNLVHGSGNDKNLYH